MNGAHLRPRARPRRAPSRVARVRAVVGAAMLLGGMLACDRGTPAGESGASTAVAPGEVAIDLAGTSGAVMLVKVYINGAGPFDFVLDTGATMTCLDRALADSLGLPARFGAPGVGIGVGGKGEVPIVRIDSLRTGDASATKVGACVLDLSHLKALGPTVQGLLGLDFLKAYRVTLDFERGVAKLEKP